MKKLISAIDARHLTETAAEQNWEDTLATEIEKAARSGLTEVTLGDTYRFREAAIKKLNECGYKVFVQHVGSTWVLTISW